MRDAWQAVRLEVVTDAKAPVHDYLPALVLLLRRMRDRGQAGEAAGPRQVRQTEQQPAVGCRP